MLLISFLLTNHGATFIKIINWKRIPLVKDYSPWIFTQRILNQWVPLEGIFLQKRILRIFFVAHFHDDWVHRYQLYNKWSSAAMKWSWVKNFNKISNGYCSTSYSHELNIPFVSRTVFDFRKWLIWSTMLLYVCSSLAVSLRSKGRRWHQQ